MKILFNNKNNLWLLIGIILAPAANSMYYPAPEPFMQSPYIQTSFDEWYQTVMANQALSQQNTMLQQMIIKANFNHIVAEAKKLPLQTDGSCSEIAKQLLKEAATAGHPEALYLLGDKRESKACQQWRLNEALDQFKHLKNSCPDGSLNIESSAYHLLNEIVKHPYLPIPDDLDIRAKAYYCLGHMYLQNLGVLAGAANKGRATFCFKTAEQLGNPQSSKLFLEKLKNSSVPPATPTETQLTVVKPQTPAKEATEKSTDTKQPAKQEASIIQVDYRVGLVKRDVKVTEKPKPQPKIALMQEPLAETRVQNLIDEIEQAKKSDLLHMSTDNQASKPAPQIIPAPISAPKIQACEQKSKPAAKNKIVKGDSKCKLPPSEPDVPTFAISVDLSTPAAPTAVIEGQSHLQQKHKPCAQKVQKLLSRKQEKIKKAHEKKIQSQKRTTPDQVVADQISAPEITSAPQEQQKESTPHEKKQKQTKTKKDTACKEKTITHSSAYDGTQAFTLVSQLISYYINDNDIVGAIKSDLCPLSFNWTSAGAVYKGSYNHLARKYTAVSANVPELMAILNYLQGNILQAQELILKSTATDDVTQWYKALITLSGEKESEERNIRISKHIDSALLQWPPVPKKLALLYLDDKIVEFITKIANQPEHASADISRLLCMKIVINARANKNIVAELMNDQYQDSPEASVLLARMFAEGIYEKQSLARALSILQESMGRDNTFNADRSRLLIVITRKASDAKDYLSMLHASYLDAVEICKSCDDEMNLLMLLKRIETSIENVLKEKLVDALRTQIANVLWDSGAYDILVERAKKDENIALSLYTICLLADKLMPGGIEPERFAKISELATEFQKKRIEYNKACSLVRKLITKYVHTEKSDELDKINQKLDTEFNNCDTAIGVYKIAYIIAQEHSQGNAACSELIAILHYLQGNITQANDIMNRCPDNGSACSSWYRALIKLGAEPASAQRDNAICNYVSHALSVSLDNPQLKNVCIFDNKLVKFLTEKMSVDRDVKPLLSLMTMLFGCNVVGLDRDTAIQYLLDDTEHHKGGTSCFLLAQLYTDGTFVPQSLPKALSFLQQIIDENNGILLHALLEKICELAKNKNDMTSQIHATCLFIIHMEQLSNEKCLMISLSNLIDTCNALAHSPNVYHQKEIKAVSNILKSTGAYKSLLRAAKNNHEIALKLLEIVKILIEYCANSEEWCEQAIELADPLQLSSEEEQTQKTAQTSIQEPVVKDTNADQGKLQKSKIIVEWQTALNYYASEQESEARNNKILACLQSALFCSPICYSSIIKNLLICDREFKEYIQTLAVTNNIAAIILQRLNFIVNGTTLTPESFNMFAQMNNKGIIPASLWLAESTLYGEANSESLTKALTILQQVTAATKKYDFAVMQQICNALKIADQNGDLVNQIYALNLAIVECSKRTDCPILQFIPNKLVIAEMRLRKIKDKNQKEYAARLLQTSGAYNVLLPLAARDTTIAQCLGDIIGTRIECYHHSEHEYSDGIEIAARACNTTAQQFKELFVKQKQYALDPISIESFHVT